MGFILDGLDAESYDRQYTERHLLSRILQYFRPTWRIMGVVSLLVVVGSGMDAALPFFLAQGLDALVGSLVTFKVVMIIIAIVFVGSCSWVCTFLRQWLTARTVGDVVLNVRKDVFKAVLKHDMSFFTGHASGKIVSRITSDTEDFAIVVTLTINLLGQIMFMLLLLVILFTLNGPLTLIVLATAPVIIGVALAFRGAARRTFQRMQRVQATVNATIQESISGISIAKNFRQEQAIYADFQQVNKQSFRVGVQQGILFSSIFPLLVTIAGIGTACLVYFGGKDVVHGVLTLGYWLLFVQSASLFWMPLASIASFWSQFQQGLAASERVFGLIDATPSLNSLDAQEVGHLNGKIEFRDVTFRYTEEDVLSHFNATFKAGEVVALVGHTGAGKSTLFKLISRFYNFQEGRLLIDDRDIRSLDLQQYRHRLGIVPQIPFLFSGTVADNIRYIKPYASDDDVVRAAQQIGGGMWLEALPRGLHSIVDEGGKNLSLGQRQLIALSRIMLQDPAIILLDEATASVDPLTEAQIQEGLDLVLADRTALVIAHRLSTVRHAHRILVLDKGQVVEEGTHKELIQREEYYGELYNTYFRHQALDYEPGKGFVSVQ